LTFNDLLRVFWQRKLLIVVVMILVIGPAYAATKFVSPEYQSTATLSLAPATKDTNDLSVFLILDQVVPIYSDLATAPTTLDQASRLAGGRLADITVQTFKGTGLIKIKARSTSRSRAQASAAAVASVLLSRAESGDISIPSLKLTELGEPAYPGSPVFPRTKLTLLVAALLGLGLGLAAAVLRESLTTKVESADELAAVAEVPVYAEIPAESAVLKMHSPEDLARIPRLRIVSEAFRDLRTNLLFTDEGIRSVLITSPDGSHGKTTVAFGLAATLARAGTRTLLVDADLRRGRVAELLELPRSPGLMDVLIDETDIEDTVRVTHDGLHVLVGGRRSADPGELLTSAFPTLLTRLERDYEAVIIDSTPVIPISDARIIARYADATILVARAGFALRRHVRAAVERLGLINVQPTAAVLNYSAAVRASSYYVQPSGEEPAEKISARRVAERRGAARR
jgi:capsular exopolysaccharide synthesis family protein